MACVLPLVFVALGILQPSWGSVSPSLLGPSISAVAAEVVDEALEVGRNEYCFNCIKIDNFCYNHSYLFELDAPFGDHIVVNKMGIMNYNNILYYIFEPKFSDPEYSKAAFVSLDSPKYSGVISGWQRFNFRTLDINQRQRKVYLGGSDGIWTVNSTSFVPSSPSAKGFIITNIVSKNYVYFTKTDSNGIVKINNGNYNYILNDQKINKFVLDKEFDYNIVYNNNTGLYISFNSRSQTKSLKLSDQNDFTGLTVDATGTVYAWHHVDGIYKVVLGKVPSETTLNRVSGLRPQAMTFDKSNNIIYSKGKQLLKLTKVFTRNCNSV